MLDGRIPGLETTVIVGRRCQIVIRSTGGMWTWTDDSSRYLLLLVRGLSIDLAIKRRC